MTSSKPPDGESGLPSSETLWQILHDSGQLTSEKPAGLPTPPAKEPAAAAPETQAPAGRPAETEISLIERILTVPGDIEEELELRTEAPREEDFDRALLNYYRDMGVTVSCRNHPDTHAVTQCPECQAYYCQACMVVRRGRMLCKDCAEALFVPTAEEVLAAQERGQEAPEHDVLQPEFPEFQVGIEAFGREGAPASPLKRMFALVLDLIVTRVLLLLLLLVLGIFFHSSPAAIFHLFDADVEGPVPMRVLRATLLFSPPVPWLIFFAVFDYLYYFLCLSFTNRTVGMSWLGCRIVTEWGDFVSFSAVAVRTLVFMVCLGFPAILIGWLFPAYRGPHDYAAGTVVINYAGVKRVDAYETVQIKL